jgi:hypothetical protein
MDNGNNALDLTRTSNVGSTPDQLKQEVITSFVEGGAAANEPFFNEDFHSQNLLTGLDTAKFTENERNIIARELARMGADVGFELTGYLLEQRAGRLAENVKGDGERALKKQKMWERFLALMAYYDAMYNEALQMLDTMLGYVDDRIAEIDTEIDAYKKDTIEHNFNGSSDADEHIRQLKAEKEELKRIKAEELEAHKEQLEADAVLPDLDHLTDIGEHIAETVTSSSSSARNTPSRARMAALMARYRGAADTSDNHDETETPQGPSLYSG